MKQTLIAVRNTVTGMIAEIPAHWMDGPLGASYECIGTVEDFYKCKKETETRVKRSYVRKIKENDV